MNHTHESIDLILQELAAQKHSCPDTILTRELGVHIRVGICGLRYHYIFLGTEQLFAKLPTVAKHLGFDRWKMEPADEEVQTNRLQFNPGPDYRTLCATVALKLLEKSLDPLYPSVQAWFSETEHLIHIILEKARLSSEETIGLLGELFVILRILLTLKPDSVNTDADDPTYFWKGSLKGKKDLELATCDIEIKTTTQSSRIHHFHGFEQLESNSERPYFVASLGLERDIGGPFSIQNLSERIRNEIRKMANKPDDAVNAFNNRLNLYGRNQGFSSSNITDLKNDARATALFTPASPLLFFRMSDPALKFFRNEDRLKQFPLLEQTGFECSLNFDTVANGVDGSQKDNPLRVEQIAQNPKL